LVDQKAPPPPPSAEPNKDALGADPGIPFLRPG
jgi:hypothetical protein